MCDYEWGIQVKMISSLIKIAHIIKMAKIMINDVSYE